MADPYKTYTNIYVIPANANCPIIPDLAQKLRDNAERTYEMTNLMPRILFQSGGKWETIEQQYDYKLWPQYLWSSMLDTWIFIPNLEEYTKLKIKIRVGKETGCDDPEIKINLKGITIDEWTGTGWHTFEKDIRVTSTWTGIRYGRWNRLIIVWKNRTSTNKMMFASSVLIYLTK